MVNNYGFVNKLNYGVIKDECLEMYLIRLDLVKGKVYNEEEKRFIKWLKIINGKEIEEMREEAKEDEVMERALQFMEEFLADEEIKNVYDKINDVERNAREEEKMKTAKNLLQLNIAIEDISKATGLSIQELKNLE